jgi:hypothetical protein
MANFSDLKVGAFLMRAEFKLAAVAVVAVLGSTAAAQAQALVAPVVNSGIYTPTYSAWDGFYLGAQGWWR